MRSAVGSALGITIPWLHARTNGLYASPTRAGAMIGSRTAL
ncbi:MAG TPA: hypothetical protein VFX59_01990 [Polyangiales bacterium]|nr:hypothetical protein [Polyangiales bacterium]